MDGKKTSAMGTENKVTEDNKSTLGEYRESGIMYLGGGDCCVPVGSQKGVAAWPWDPQVDLRGVRRKGSAHQTL